MARTRTVIIFSSSAPQSLSFNKRKATEVIDLTLEKKTFNQIACEDARLAMLSPSSSDDPALSAYWFRTTRCYPHVGYPPAGELHFPACGCCLDFNCNRCRSCLGDEVCDKVHDSASLVEPPANSSSVLYLTKDK